MASWAPPKKEGARQQAPLCDGGHVAAALSTEYSRFTKIPDREHVARWWPKTSSGQAHWQVREVTGTGSPRQVEEGKRDEDDEDTDKKERPDMGPDWNLRRASLPFPFPFPLSSSLSPMSVTPTLSRALPLPRENANDRAAPLKT